MSSLSFTCVVTEEVAEAEAFLSLLKDACSNGDTKKQQDLKTRLGKPAGYQLPSMSPSLSVESGALTFQVEVGSSVDLDFFDDVASILENISGIHFRAVLFDSSSNGVQVWQLPEKEPLDIDDKHVLFIGDMEEDLDEMKELVEDACTLQDALDEDTEILIIGHHVDQSLLDTAKQKGLAIYTEQDFWDYIEELPG